MPQVNEKVSIENHKIFSTGESFSISDLNIFPFQTPHDAADPCGFNILRMEKRSVLQQI